MLVRRAALAASLLCVSRLSAAQSAASYGGPYAPIVLLLPAGARTLAMGNTGISSRDDDVMFFNPAQVAIARGFGGSFERYSSTAAGGSLSAVTRFNSGGIALGVRTVDYELPQDVFPANRGSMLGAGPVNGTSMEASIAVAQVIKGLRIGGAGKYVEDNVGTLRASRGALDLGVSKDILRSYTVGIAVQNIGKSMTIPCSYEPASLTACVVPPGNPLGGPPPIQLTSANLPLRTTLGVATARPMGEFDVAATAAVSMLRADWVGPSGGVEVGYSWLDGYSIAVRGGARRPLPGETPFTLGLGFTMDRLSIDYAFEQLRGSSDPSRDPNLTPLATHAAHRLGLRIR